MPKLTSKYQGWFKLSPTSTGRRIFCLINAVDPSCVYFTGDETGRKNIYCHLCGNILPIAEDLVETGLDCIGPLKPLRGSTPAEVKKRVGEAVSPMGGVDSLSFISNAPEEIIAEARQCMIQAGERGGTSSGRAVLSLAMRKERMSRP
jgi:hypothetical protein